MNFFIVYAHPEPKSFNGALTSHAKKALEAAGHKAIVSDLYSMQFNPVSDRRNFISETNPDYYKQQAEELHATEVDGFAADIKAEMEKLDWCDVLIFQFPLWWFGFPAILKGWVDKVFALGKIYGNGKWYDNGAFKGKKAMLSLTTGGPLTMYTEIGINGDIHTILYPINHGLLRFVGFDVLPPFIVWGASRLSDERRQIYLEQYQNRLLTIDRVPAIIYPSVDDFDETFQLKTSEIIIDG